MKTFSGGGNSSSAAGSRDRKTKRRRVTADPKALPKDLPGDDEQTSVAPKGSANDGSNEKVIVRASSSEIDKVLPKVTRGGFEQLVRRQLVEGIPITLADLTAAAQSASKRKAESSSSSDTGRKLRKLITSTTPTAKETRVINTEGWAGIPSDVMRDVLGRLNLREKVVCVSKVCRAWNAFKTIPGLFVDLSDKSGPPTARDLGKFLKWVPDIKSVTGVRVVATEGCGFMAVFTALSEIETAHRSKENKVAIRQCLSDLDSLGNTNYDENTLINIEKIILTGPKINGLLLDTVESNGIGPRLKVLRICNVSQNELRTSGGLEAIIGRSTNLVTLEVPSFVLFSTLTLRRGDYMYDLSVALSSMIPHGNSSSTTLKVLDLTMQSSDDSETSHCSPLIMDCIKWSDIAKIGTLCPNLEVLKVPMIVDPNRRHRGAVPQTIQSPMASLPRLRVFSVGRIIKYSTDFLTQMYPFYYSTEGVSCLLSWFIAGMPLLEELSLCHGFHDHTNNALRLPDIGQGLSECPPTLRKLHLKDFNLQTTSLLSSGIDSDSIESITLENCGEAQTDALRSFCLRYQGEMGTQKTTSIEVGDDGTSYFVCGDGDITLSDTTVGIGSV